MKHQKHTKLVRPNLGTFHRNEWAIIGTPCGQIKKLAYQIIEKMSSFEIGYVDADHAHGDHSDHLKTNALDYGAVVNYEDKIKFHRFDSHKSWNKFQYRSQFNDTDLVIVNGNHFTAKHQIVVIDQKKETSLSKKLDRLTDVSMILTLGEKTEIFPFLMDTLDMPNIPVFHISEMDKIVDVLAQKMETKRPPIHGLVLVGGKSTRMGQDKALINYHGKPQQEFVYEQLTKVCDKVFISCREDQEDTIPFPTITDTFTGLGPFGGILSAFRTNPDAAWLVIATDLPLVNENTIRQLIEQRNSSKLATAFNSPENEFPEPLITIWEPRAYPILLNFLTQGYSCPRKVLINSDVKLLNAKDSIVLKNVNLPDELDEIRKILK